MRIVLIGAGRLATQLAQALNEAGHQLLAVYSRTMTSAEALGRLVGCRAVDDVKALPLEADAFIITVKDSAIGELLPQLAEGREGQTFFHTAGSVPLSVFDSTGLMHYGVLYPMQTFSKERKVDFSRVPLFIEGSDAGTIALAQKLAASVSQSVRELSSEQRRYLHLAAVFACNFANACYAISSDVAAKAGLPFEVMIPLIEETAAKVGTMHPLDAQTGPAVRYDEQVIEAQSRLLADTPQIREVYDLMSKLIHQQHT